MISMVVSWRDRHELERALPAMLVALDAVGGDLNLVNFSGTRDLLDAQLGDHAARVNLVEIGDERYFNKAAAQNLGAAHSRNAFLFFCDCDIVLDADALSGMLALLHADRHTFGTLAGVRESELNSRQANHVVSFGYELNIRTADGRHLRIVDNEEDADNGTRQAPGLLFVRREDFEAINGYNGRLHGWGWEDQDMISRLTLGLGLRRIQHGTALHLSHDDHARIGFYPPVSSRWESRDRMFRAALDNYDRRDFSGTWREDVARFADRVRLRRAVPV
ncbi:MAG: glycosyltransferase [Lysobacteraceae bacterium]|nr:MAG: glycosyltransferase [Xanthomonadaceae bacterium]